MSVEHVRPGPDGDVRLDLEQRFASREVVQGIVSKMPSAASPSNLLADRQWVRDHASQAVKDKADKVSGAADGDFAGLDGSGNLTDSGKKPSDYEFESGASGKVSDPWACVPPTTPYGTPFSVKWTADPAEGEGWALFAGGTKQGRVLGNEGSTELSWSPAAQTSGFTVSAARQLSGTEYHLKGQPNAKLQPAGDYASGRQGARADTAVQPPDLLGFVDGADYDAAYGNPPKPTILLKHGSTVVASVDATAFVIDGMVEDVRIEGGNLVIVFNTAAGGREIDIPLTDIFDPANYYDKDAVDEKLGKKRDKTDLNVYPPVYSDWVIVVGGAALTDGHRLAWRSDVNVWQVYDKNGLGAGMSSTSTEDALSCSGFITGVSAGSTFTATRSRSSDTLVKASQIPPATVGKIVYATCHTDQSNANKVAGTAAGGFSPTAGAVVCVHFDRFPSGESTLSVDDSDAYPIWLRLFADGTGLRAGESSWGNNDNVLVLFMGDKWLMLGAVPATPDEYGTVHLKHSLDDNDSRATVNQPTLKAAFDRKLDATEGVLNALGYVYSDWDMSAFPATFQSSQPQTYYNDVVNKYEWIILTGSVVVSDEKYDTEADALAALSITLRGPQLPDGAVATRARTATSYRLGTAGGPNAGKPLQPAGDYATKVSPATAGNLAQLTQDGGIEDSGVKVSAKLDSSATGFAEFDATRTYVAGVAVVYKGHAYISTTTHSGAWDPGHFDEMPVVVNRTTATGGVAVGEGAKATNDGTAAGRGAEANATGSVATGASAFVGNTSDKGVAVGSDAKVYAQHGTAVGHGAEVSAEKAAAFGYNAKVAASKTGAVQLGAGTNQHAYSLQFRSTTVVDTNGKIPAANLDDSFKIAGDAAYKTWEISGGTGDDGHGGDNQAIYSRGTYTYDAASGTWVRDASRLIRRKAGTTNFFELVADPGSSNPGVITTFEGFGSHVIESMTYSDYTSTGVSIASSAPDTLARNSDVQNNAGAIEYLRRMFSGQMLPQNPTQNQMAKVVKTIFTQLGGTIQ